MWSDWGSRRSKTHSKQLVESLFSGIDSKNYKCRSCRRQYDVQGKSNSHQVAYCSYVTWWAPNCFSSQRNVCGPPAAAVALPPHRLRGVCHPADAQQGNLLRRMWFPAPVGYVGSYPENSPALPYQFVSARSDDSETTDQYTTAQFHTCRNDSRWTRNPKNRQHR